MKLKLIPGALTISSALGLTDDRKKEVYDKVNNICKEEMEKADSTHANVIERVWNEFEGSAPECAFAMYILTHEEDNAVINKLFASEGAAEAVASN